MSLEIPTMYLCIHHRLKQNSERDYIERKKAISIIEMIYHIQKRLAVVVLKELENFKLVEVLFAGKNGKIKILNTKYNLENTSKIYKSVGLY